LNDGGLITAYAIAGALLAVGVLGSRLPANKKTFAERFLPPWLRLAAALLLIVLAVANRQWWLAPLSGALLVLPFGADLLEAARTVDSGAPRARQGGGLG